MKSRAFLVVAIAGICFSWLCGGMVQGQTLQRVQRKPLVLDKFEKAQQVAHGLATCEGDPVWGRIWAVALNKDQEISDCCVRLVTEPFQAGTGKFKATATIDVTELLSDARTYLSLSGITASTDQWIDGDLKEIREPGTYKLATPYMNMTPGGSYSAEVAICVRGAVAKGSHPDDPWTLPWHHRVRYRREGCRNCATAVAATAGKVKIELQ